MRVRVRWRADNKAKRTRDGCSDRGVVGVETFYHPLNRIWHDQDGGETTVLSGEWTSTGRSDRYHRQRRPLVAIVRSVDPLRQITASDRIGDRIGSVATVPARAGYDRKRPLRTASRSEKRRINAATELIHSKTDSVTPVPEYIHTYIHTNLYSAKIVERIWGAGTGWLGGKSGLEEMRL